MWKPNGTDVFCFSKHYAVLLHTLTIKHAVFLLQHYYTNDRPSNFQQRFISTSSDFRKLHKIWITCTFHFIYYTVRWSKLTHTLTRMADRLEIHIHLMCKMLKDVNTYLQMNFGSFFFFLRLFLWGTLAKAEDRRACPHSSIISRSLIWGWILVVRLMRNLFDWISFEPTELPHQTLDLFKIFYYFG